MRWTNGGISPVSRRRLDVRPLVRCHHWAAGGQSLYRQWVATSGLPEAGCWTMSGVPPAGCWRLDIRPLARCQQWPTRGQMSDHQWGTTGGLLVAGCWTINAMPPADRCKMEVQNSGGPPVATTGGPPELPLLGRWRTMGSMFTVSIHLTMCHDWTIL